jgi:hypothetical protein
MYCLGSQPAFEMHRLTISDILQLIESQTAEKFKVSDFVPVPCCFPTCNSVTYAFIDGEQVAASPVCSLAGHTALSPAVREPFLSRWRLSRLFGDLRKDVCQHSVCLAGRGGSLPDAESCLHLLIGHFETD